MPALTKIVKPLGATMSDIEKQIATAFADLEASSDNKAQLKGLFIVGAKEVDVGNKRGIIIYVPFPQLKLFQKMQQWLVREFEKKFSGKHIVIIARRRILPKQKRGMNWRPEKQKRPRSRTLTAVHDAILSDLVYPAEVVGRRIRVKLDGKRIMKVHLDKNNQTNVEHKIETFGSVYKHLTGKEVYVELLQHHSEIHVPQKCPTYIRILRVIMPALTKIVKPLGATMSDIEKQIATAFADLEASSDNKAQLKGLFIVGAKEVDVGNKRGIIIYVPFPQLKLFQKMQQWLVREFEKKFSGKHIVIIARRRILPKQKRGMNWRPEKQKRPRSRTLTAVHDAILSDLVYPAEVVGRRIRVKLDGKRIMKVHLDKNNQTNVEHKIETFGSVYKHLTGKEVRFEFPEPLF